MGPAQINGYYNAQQNRIGKWEFPVRGMLQLRLVKIKMSNFTLASILSVIMKTKTKKQNKTVEDKRIEAIRNAQYQKDLTLLQRFGLELGAGREFKSHLDFGIF